MTSYATLSATPLPGIPIIAAGDDLAQLIGDAIARQGIGPEQDDVIVVAQKIVSKAEGRTAHLADVTPGAEAIRLAHISAKDPRLVELILSETIEVLRAVQGVVITRHRHGHVLANAGIDGSNVAGRDDIVLLWPEDPDRSAHKLRAAIRARFGVRVAVIISDSLGRAWRLGTLGTAIGIAGMLPLRDQRGETDLFGRELKATITAVADEIAAAASLVIGEGAEGTPVAIVRGARYAVDESVGVSDILRPVDQDLFR